MSELHFSYCMELQYEHPVSKCCFTMKCIPRDDLRQRLIRKEIEIYPETMLSYGEDAFGNTQIYGCESMPHQSFRCRISGMVETHEGYYVQNVIREKLGMYKYPHGKCIPYENIWRLDHEFGNRIGATDLETAQSMMDFLYRHFAYEPFSTNVETTAEQAAKAGKGVCQDYAHIFITMLRMRQIPARYVCGFIVGEGESHAWVEAVCDGKWLAFDPTYNCMITEDYIKTGEGRDALDCALNRGTMWGGGLQIQKVSVSVENTISEGKEQ